MLNGPSTFKHLLSSSNINLVLSKLPMLLAIGHTFLPHFVPRLLALTPSKTCMSMVMIFTPFGPLTLASAWLTTFIFFWSFFLKGNQLCISNTSVREQLIRELHCISLSSHIDRDKIVVFLDYNSIGRGLNDISLALWNGWQLVNRLKERLKTLVCTLLCLFHSWFGKI